MTDIRADTGEPTVSVFSTPEDAAHDAAHRIANALSAAATARSRADWATTGGSTPVGIYRALRESEFRDRVPWTAVHAWWGDDRFVPRDHPKSNVLPFDQVLLGAAALAGLSGTGEDSVSVALGVVPAAPIEVGHVHAMPIGVAIGEGRPASWVAEAYEAELRAADLQLDAHGYPIFDVILAGIGGDGHILSAFPGSAVFDDGGWVKAVPAPQHIEPHIERVSLNPAILPSARLLLVVALGAEKREIVAQLLGPERDPVRWPAQLARRAGAEWLLDADAAAGLPS
ncbi:MAG TPA: 6-phosphogluconolactonase [Candidatus Eisenbacteria bacterium]|nr:6-phosphogluconolactonase [Candidatus Eisenbacteria bacterium]